MSRAGEPSPAEAARLRGLYDSLRERLLDLSRRNPMLNTRLRPRSRRQLRLVDATLEEVHARLARGATLDLAALPEPDLTPADERTPAFQAAFEHAKVSDPEHLARLDALDLFARDDEAELARLDALLRDAVRARLGLPARADRAALDPAAHARAHGIDPSLDLPPRREEPAERLQSLLLADDLEARCEAIADAARLAEQEMGVSTLFLALGFLEWYESDASDAANLAPLLLLPVRLERRQVRGRRVFSLRAAGEGAEANLTLHAHLAGGFGRRLPAFEPGAGDDAVEGHLDAVRDAVDGLRRWRVRRFLVLGHFAFGRLAMHEDLDPGAWGQHPASHPLVEAVLRGAERGAEAALPGLPPDHAVDEPEWERLAPILVHDADSSQHSAVIDAMRGLNLVVQGPPGTGKSQTITNIIANALHRGQRVLFLAEKLAALEVVKRRLDLAGLGAFCLELHSDKAGPRAVLDQLRTRAALQPEPAPPANRAAWERARAELRAYLDALHRPGADGATAHGLIWRSIAGRDRLGGLAGALDGLAPPDGLLDDADSAREALSDLALYADAAAAFERDFGPVAASPWRDVPFRDRPAPRDVLAAIEALAAGAGELAALAEAVGDPGWTGPERLAGLARAADALPVPPDAAGLPGLLALDPGDLARALDEARLLLDAGDALAGADDLAALSGAQLAAAASLGPLADPLGDHRPAEAYARIRAEAERAERLCPLLDAFAPALRRLGLWDRPLEALPAALIASAFAAALDPGLHGWIGWAPPGGEAAFDAAHRDWTALIQAEAGWRERLGPDALDARPGAEALSAAAATLSGGGLGGLAARLTGALARARALAAGLGLGGGAGDATLLRALAAHAEAVEGFEAGTDHAGALGPVWAGLATPFARLATVRAARRLLADRLAAEPHGDRVAAAFRALPAEEVAELAALAGAGRALLDALRPDDLAPGATPGEAAAAFAGARERAALLASADPERLLAGSPRPLGELVRLGAHERRRRVLAARLESGPAGAFLLRRGLRQAELARLGMLAAHAAAVAGLDLPAPLRSDLLSEAAPASHARLAEWGRRAEAGRQRVGQAAAALEALGVGGLDRAEAPALLHARARRLLDHRSSLRDWLALGALRARLRAHGLGPVLARVEEGGLLPHLPELVAQFLDARRAARLVGAGALAEASGPALGALRARFAAEDRARLAADRAALRARLAPAAVAPGRAEGPRATWTEMACLRNEWAKQRNLAPVRQLLARAPRSIQALAPCWMMSPLSLAKYLPRAEIAFDLLVIDEASQMRPEDAVGALLRARQVVVVGDPQQLPPTDFFQRTGAEADEEAEDIDDESILEACLKAFGAVRPLRWHYRSRSESLIAFSNRHFYDGELVTFPEARPGSFAVDLVRVDGRYQARRNPEEARALAEEAAALMRRHADDPAAPSLGLVALNTDQRDLLFEELRLLTAGDERVERYREAMRARGEDVFVKNLENVQGDERDVVLVSLTYGREPGREAVMQRFGPINRRQGHRRLNVLFTRARQRIRLFASMGSADIVAGEGASRGVHVLKSYLDYVERRGDVAEGRPTGRAPDSDFEVAVMRRLRARGYRVDPQVGVSGFRIDLGVRDPDRPDSYLAGVECDGAAYHSGRGARDRDRLREEVLRGLGWRLLRVWSTDWFDDPDRETERLAAGIERLREAARRPAPAADGAAGPADDGRPGPAADAPALADRTDGAEEPRPLPRVPLRTE